VIKTTFALLHISKNLRSLEANKYSISITECIKPYLYKRRKNTLIRPFNSADNNPPQAGSAYSILPNVHDIHVMYTICALFGEICWQINVLLLLLLTNSCSHPSLLCAAVVARLQCRTANQLLCFPNK